MIFMTRFRLKASTADFVGRGGELDRNSQLTMDGKNENTRTMVVEFPILRRRSLSGLQDGGRQLDVEGLLLAQGVMSGSGY